MIKETTLVVKVIPKSSRSALVGWEENTLKIRLKALPEKGEANDELIAFLAKTLDLSKSSISITHGHTSRLKRLKIEGLSKDELMQRLQCI